MGLEDVLKSRVKEETDQAMPVGMCDGGYTES
jgi:hypothetical protein